MDETEEKADIAPPPLHDQAGRLYRFVAESPGCTAEAASAALGTGRRETDEAVRELRELGLLSTDGTEAGHLFPHPIEFARVKVLNPLQRDLNRRQALIDGLRSGLDELELHTRPQRTEGSLEIVPELSDVRRLISGFAEECCEEALASQPGGAREEEVLADSMDRTTKLLRRGVRMRSLYQHTARFSPTTLSYVALVTPLGDAQVRTLASGFPRCIIFDRKIGILPLLNGSKGAVIVHDPQIVSFVADAFDRAWTLASDLSPDEGRADRVAATSEIQNTIISLLIQGESDKRISQVVGISLRNCQRHISHIMKSIGARNRLHAGYLLSKEPFSGH
ncbi:LuxR C-terminal-related transcriptional regulator [Streptomyces sp. NPDC048623]|uniref:LuxR C-terminal-related transcriptional regulator n=1 Tax=Streptomyces sp. NPDC048623 TaxID=3155761 RepID=UPI0034261F0F